MKMERRWRMTHPQATGCSGLPAAIGSQERTWDEFSIRAFRRNQPCRHLDFSCLAPTTVRKCIPAVLSHQVCGTFYSSSRKRTQGISKCADFQGRQGMWCGPVLVHNSHSTAVPKTWNFQDLTEISSKSTMMITLQFALSPSWSCEIIYELTTCRQCVAGRELG